jgi:hypothetical protein
VPNNNEQARFQILRDGTNDISPYRCVRKKSRTQIKGHFDERKRAESERL